MAKKLLILSVSAGAGHVRAAAALVEACKKYFPDVEVKTVDGIQYMNSIYRRIYLGSYYYMIGKAYWMWRMTYNQWDGRPENGIARKMVLLLDRLCAGRLFKLIKEENPTHIIATHFTMAELLAYQRRHGRLGAPFGVTVTDYDAHAMWVNDGTDRYFVASDEYVDVITGKGADKSRVVVSGIPVDPIFAEPLEKSVARTGLGLLEMPTVLVTSGGAGFGGIINTVQAIAKQGPVQILAVAGHNKAVKAQLEALEMPEDVRLMAYGFVDFMRKLMAAADVFITKPGGLSSTEALTVGLPMIITDPIPGQEEHNAEYLLKHGAAVQLKEGEDVGEVVGSLLNDAVRLSKMKESAQRASRPNAARDIVEQVLSL